MLTCLRNRLQFPNHFVTLQPYNLINMASEDIKPGLFGQKHSNRAYDKGQGWGKNQFNSSFPASLVAYMSSKGLQPVYICLDKNLKVQHKYLSGEELFGLDPLSDNLYYSFETSFPPYEQYFIGLKKNEHIDLVLYSLEKGKEPLRGLEIKLTALPDSSTRNSEDEKLSCEVVVRNPTICYVACSICEHYKTQKQKDRLRELLTGVPHIDHWNEQDSVGPHYTLIRDSVVRVMADMVKHQSPIMIQPVWKTDKRSRLTDDCLDVFVWSNIALIKICTDAEFAPKKEKDGSTTYNISRFNRSVVWLYRMLFDYVTYNGVFNYANITSLMSSGGKNDKAFAASGNRTYAYLKSPELAHPRIGKDEIKNIIQGNGHLLLQPERRFDAIIVNTPGLFE